MPHTPPTKKWPVAILGATGAVGQTFIRLLEGHPWFEVAQLAASERSAGKTYREAVTWFEGDLPERVASLPVVACDPKSVTAPIVFSALDANVAGEIEAAFARAGCVVFSNAKNHRMEPDVPLLIPEVNAPHLLALATQRKRYGWKDLGAIVTNANCATTAAVIPLAPLHEAFGVEQVFVATMQAVSGAGYPGVPSLDILGNVIPFIADEEAKIERELAKMLGQWTGSAIVPASIGVSAHANRVPVEHGHTVCLSVKLKTRASVADAHAALESWRGHAEARGLPSALGRPIIVSDDPRRPQPRRDVGRGNGMAVTVGRIRSDPLWDLRLVALAHNVVRGAAGGSIFNAELMAARGELPAS
ncbi:MAG TPA: aspartate-semialdehyde dehydrogenase [Gemmatimonadales bacterium]|jgi:aspartate-semialdehyde dehydrogenase